MAAAMRKGDVVEHLTFMVTTLLSVAAVEEGNDLTRPSASALAVLLRRRESNTASRLSARRFCRATLAPYQPSKPDLTCTYGLPIPRGFGSRGWTPRLRIHGGRPCDTKRLPPMELQPPTQSRESCADMVQDWEVLVSQLLLWRPGGA